MAGRQDAGGEPVLLAPDDDKVQTVNNDLELAETVQPDLKVADASVEDYTGLVLPGGVANPDKLRLDVDAVGFVKAFAVAGKPIAAICHGPWTLVEAGLVEGKTMTSWPSLQTDIRNGGGDWRDEEVWTCRRRVSRWSPVANPTTSTPSTRPSSTRSACI